MANMRPRTYTERVAVCVTAGQREALRQWAGEHDTAMSIVLREAALAQIGRLDLSVAEKTAFPIGEMLQRQPYTKPKRRHGARIVVNLTAEQLEALEAAAAARQVNVSSLLRDAGLAELGLKPAPALKRGGQLGRRMSTDP